MTVYIDDAFIRARVGRINSRWCHLFADTEEELHALAQSIGMRRSWFQQAKGAKPESLRAQQWHYDVTESRWEDAVRAGAFPVTRREAHHIIAARHARLFPDHAIATQGVVLEPPEHVWPLIPTEFDLRQGCRWCMRCGRMLWTYRRFTLPDVKPCQVVHVEFRESATATPPGGIEILSVEG